MGRDATPARGGTDETRDATRHGEQRRRARTRARAAGAQPREPHTWGPCGTQNAACALHARAGVPNAYKARAMGPYSESGTTAVLLAS